MSVTTYEDALSAVDDCTECPHWVAEVIRDEVDELRDALADIYRGYEHNDNELYDALNRHRELSPLFCPTCSWCLNDLGPERSDVVGQFCRQCIHLVERHDSEREATNERQPDSRTRNQW